MKVRLYVEGGPQRGSSADGIRRFRNSFKQHLIKLDPRLKAIDVSPCGSTDAAIRDYARAIRENPQESLVALLVDSDSEVTAGPLPKHLEGKLNSAKVPRDSYANVFLMVQFMESWFITDIDALESCFGAVAKEVKWPQNVDVERVPKREILDALDRAARNTPTRHYHKIQDSVRILEHLRPDIVATRSKHARSLHAFLRKAIQR